jgi:putative holliday junction resolvase
LAIDYGRQRIGLAITDELGTIASPLPVMERKNRRDDIRRLRRILLENRVGLVLVGCPLHLSGRRGEMADEVARFAQRIERELRVNVELHDERLTSWEAREILEETGGGKRKKKEIDSMAAAILLREYLDTMRAKQRSSSTTEV